MNAFLRILVFVLAAVVVMAPQTSARAPGAKASPSGIVVKTLAYGDSRLVLSYAPSDFRLSEKEIVDWVLRSARATATYFGRFPVAEVRIALAPAEGADVGEGEAWASPDARIRVFVGRNTESAALMADSTMVHEMTHLAFPDLDDSHLWLHEGIATYVEAVASAQAGEKSARAVWAHLMEEVPQGLPGAKDKGLDNTPSDDRRYWGGAMFCLLADVEIRRRTTNRFGLRDALRAILEAGGTLSTTWEVERALDIGDRAVGVPVLREAYAAWKERSVSPDLGALWRALGVSKTRDDGVRLVADAPLASIRDAITAQPDRPLLLVGPKLLYEAQRR